MLKEWWEIRSVPKLKVNNTMVEPLQEERWGADLFLKLHCLNADVLGDFEKVRRTSARQR